MSKMLYGLLNSIDADSSKEVLFPKNKRYRCKSCLQTFNDLTNTPLQRTRRPHIWVRFIECMIPYDDEFFTRNELLFKDYLREHNELVALRKTLLMIAKTTWKNLRVRKRNSLKKSSMPQELKKDCLYRTFGIKISEPYHK